MVAPSENNVWKFKCYRELDDEKYTKNLLEWLDMYDKERKDIGAK
jgi:hypothetical protein